MAMIDQNEELKRLLQEDLKLNRENNRMLHRLISVMRWGLVVSVLKWLVIIGAAAGIYYLFQPILDQFSATYEGLKNILPGGGNS